jgi:hypothetical protein
MVIGTTPTALARRGIALDRLVVLTLRRDAYATPSGQTLPLWLGERTHYRAATAIRDTFDRPDGVLGTGYAPWIPSDAGGLVLRGGQVVPGVVNAEPHLAVYGPALPREQWGEITIRALTGAGAVGLGLRLVTQSGYLVGARPGTTALRRLNAGASTTLLDLVTPWQLGDGLRLTVDWDRLRIFRNGTLIGECVDPAPLLVTGQAALYASQPSMSDAAALDDFAAGPLRQEYRGLLADVGDVSASLGFVEPTATPAAWSMSVINLAPIGIPGRFSIAWRHGQNDGPDTYDLHRTPVTLALAVAGGSVPLALAEGRVDHPEALTEGLVRLDCAGRDAFLTPDIQAGVVAYLPGPDPISTPAPIPLDPCGADAVPVIVPGSPPSEPPDPPGGAPPVAEGPEAADRPAVPGPLTLMGAYLISWDYRRNFTPEGTDGTLYVGTTQVTPLPSGYLPPPPEPDKRDGISVARMQTIGRGSAAFPEVLKETFYYRGPDIAASAFVQGRQQALTAPNNVGVVCKGEVRASADWPGVDWDWDTIWTIAGKIAWYRGETIATVADLQALRPQHPNELLDPFPIRHETLQDVSVERHPPWSECMDYCTYAGSGIHQHYTIDQGSGNFLIATVLWEKFHEEESFLVLGYLPLNTYAGPQLVRMELVSTIHPQLEVQLTLASSYFTATSGDWTGGVEHAGDVGSNSQICYVGSSNVHLTRMEFHTASGRMSAGYAGP